MCGISGCLLNRPLTYDDIARLRGIRASLAHRGPDGEGEWMDKDAGVYLSHRRLSIIDLDPRSAQPMHRGRHVITFNGEIYNYRDLKDALAPRHVFMTESDTEVLLTLWTERGAAALDVLDGMYAFALWDGAFLHLATDPFGEKPLYLYHAPEGIYFASEPAALIRAFNLSFTPTAADKASFFHLGFIMPPATGYSGLSSVTPGQHIIISRDGVKARPHWRPDPTRAPRGPIRPIEEKDINAVRDALCTSLSRRLRADVPLGLFLSGGVDSALIAALASRELGAELKTYTVAFPDGKDESIYAARIAGHLKLPHRVIDNRTDPAAGDVPGMLRDIYGLPHDNTTALPLRQMCRVAKPSLTVALSGLGGDELFFGYNRYETLWRHRAAYTVAPVLSAALFCAAPFHARAAVWKDLLSGNAARQYLRLKNGPVQSWLDSRFGKCPGLKISKKEGMVFGTRDYDLAVTMPQNYIPPVDRASMREGMEIRTPFLSRDVWAAAGRIDPYAMIAGGPKSVTRQLLARYLPPDALYPGKQGFTMPVARYLAREDLSLSHAGVAEQEIWRERTRPEYASLALRLKIWDEFTSRGETT